MRIDGNLFKSTIELLQTDDFEGTQSSDVEVAKGRYYLSSRFRVMINLLLRQLRNKSINYVVKKKTIPPICDIDLLQPAHKSNTEKDYQDKETVSQLHESIILYGKTKYVTRDLWLLDLLHSGFYVAAAGRIMGLQGQSMQNCIIRIRIAYKKHVIP